MQSVSPSLLSLLDPLQACQGFPRSGLCRVQADVSCHPGGGCAAPGLPLISPSTKNSPVTRGTAIHPPHVGEVGASSPLKQGLLGEGAGALDREREHGATQGYWSHGTKLMLGKAMARCTQ